LNSFYQEERIPWLTEAPGMSLYQKYQVRLDVLLK